MPICIAKCVYLNLEMVTILHTIEIYHMRKLFFKLFPNESKTPEKLHLLKCFIFIDFFEIAQTRKKGAKNAIKLVIPFHSDSKVFFLSPFFFVALPLNGNLK